MAYVTATHWGYGYWEDKLGDFNGGMETLSDQLWYAAEEIAYAEITSASDTQLKGSLWGGGTVTVYGRNFNSYNYDDVVITRMFSQGGSVDFDIAGSLKLGGYLGIYGTINKFEFQLPSGTVIANGQYRYNLDGDVTAFNVTEIINQPGNLRVISQTDGSGDYVRHQAQVDGHQLTLEGRWTYDSVGSWSALLGGADVLQGSSGNDYLQGFAGNDRLEGGTGTDTAVFQGSRNEYQIQSQGNGQFLITDSRSYRDGQDALVNIQRLAFDDGVLAWDSGSDGVAGQAYRLYQAAFDRTPDVAGLGYWVKQMDQGMNLQEAAARFIDSNEFQALYGVAPSNDDFLYRLYTNILDREPDAAGYDWWLEQLNTNPEKTWDRVLADFSESRENLDNMLEITGGIISFDLF